MICFFICICHLYLLFVFLICICNLYLSFVFVFVFVFDRNGWLRGLTRSALVAKQAPTLAPAAPLHCKLLCHFGLSNIIRLVFVLSCLWTSDSCCICICNNNFCRCTTICICLCNAICMCLQETLQKNHDDDYKQVVAIVFAFVLTFVFELQQHNKKEPGWWWWLGKSGSIGGFVFGTITLSKMHKMCRRTYHQLKRDQRTNQPTRTKQNWPNSHLSKLYTPIIRRAHQAFSFK